MEIETIRLTSNLLLIVGTDRGHFPMSHSFLVKDEVSALIDTGCGLELLREIDRTYGIDLIINSHCHPDHSAGNWIFESIPVHAPAMGANSHGRLGPLSIRFFPDRPFAGRWRDWITRTMGFQDKEPSEYFEDGHVFDFGHLRLQAVHTPGHTKDHFCFLEPDSGTLLTFDIDFTPFGPWYGNLESNLKDFRKSLSIVRDLKPKVVAPGHNWPIYEKIDESVDKYSRVMDQRSEAILEMLEKGMTMSDMVKAAPIYGYHPYEPEILSSFEARMIDLHIEEMLESGLLPHKI
jgi:glyoxylase-like metal-dependent hydrolase (beta-lactamase superfamily II)